LADRVTLDNKWLIIGFLENSLIILDIVNSNVMDIFLILGAMGSLINPFTIVGGETVEIYPDCAWFVGDCTLWTIGVDGDFFRFIRDILYINKGGHGIGITIDIIIFFF
jgi:hypothetical protein